MASLLTFVWVQTANKLNIPFLAQTGGNGWSTTLDKLNNNGIIIDLTGIRAVAFNSNKTQVTLQGGALISDTVAAGAANNALIPTGICNCVGTLGAILGGGIGNLMGLYGLGVDNVLSMNVVSPAGKAITVTPQTNPQLWFDFRGAGPNFDIVTSATIKSYPVATPTGLNAWLGALVFTSNQLEILIQAIDELHFQPQMAIELLFANSGNASAPPTIILSVFYYGTEAEGKVAYASIYAVGPVADETAITPYAKWNVGGDAACKGGRKPNFAAGLARMDPATWRKVYEQLGLLIKQPGAQNSSVLMNAYPLATAQSLAADDAAYPFREKLRYNAVFTPTYADPGFDATAEEFGFRVRDLWRATSGLDGNQTYVTSDYGICSFMIWGQ